MRFRCEMGKGGFIRRSEEACSAKTRFESEAEASQACGGVYRAYICPICHGFHLTNRGGRPSKTQAPKPSKTTTTPVAPEPIEPVVAITHLSPRGTPSQGPGERLAKVSAPPRKDRRAMLALEGRLVKSKPVEGKALLADLAAGQVVAVTLTDPPQILRIESA